MLKDKVYSPFVGLTADSTRIIFLCCGINYIVSMSVNLVWIFFFISLSQDCSCVIIMEQKLFQTIVVGWVREILHFILFLCCQTVASNLFDRPLFWWQLTNFFSVNFNTLSFPIVNKHLPLSAWKKWNSYQLSGL